MRRVGNDAARAARLLAPPSIIGGEEAPMAGPRGF
jgi:hypothetical protein